MALEVGNIVEGIVTGITNFGAFVTLPGGQTGLVHISEVADAYVKDIKDYLNENEKTRVKIISLDKSGKIGLSIRRVASDGSSSRRRNRRERRETRVSFEDKLARFLKESDERQSDLRRSTDEKRGGRGNPRRSADNVRAR
jgi:S1 RNA binding domain protein